MLLLAFERKLFDKAHLPRNNSICKRWSIGTAEKFLNKARLSEWTSYHIVHVAVIEASNASRQYELILLATANSRLDYIYQDIDTAGVPMLCMGLRSKRFHIFFSGVVLKLRLWTQTWSRIVCCCLCSWVLYLCCSCWPRSIQYLVGGRSLVVKRRRALISV